MSDAPLIVGVDEVGRGPLAGPVVAAAVVLCNPIPDGLADSKKLTAARRGKLDTVIRECCAYGIGVVEAEVIDRLNIFSATMLAMTQAVDRLSLIMHEKGLGAPEKVLVDGPHTPAGRVREWVWQAEGVVGGDGTVPAISAASIVAKEYRDGLMVKAAEQFDEYGWDRNKGYATREHLKALHESGPSPLHRRSFAPLRQQTLI